MTPADQQRERGSVLYAVFFVKGGQWEMWTTHTSRQEAEREAEYLRSSLGVQAKTFVRKACA